MKCPDCGENLRVYRTYPRSESCTRHYARCGGCQQRYITETTLLGPVGERRRPVSAVPLLDYKQVLTTLRGQMPRQTFDQWVRPTRLHFYNGNGRVVIAAQNSSALDWLENRLKTAFERTIATEIGHAVLVEFIVEE